MRPTQPLQNHLYQEPTFRTYPMPKEIGFVGIDTYTQPTGLDYGHYQQADNVLSVGGSPVSRPGYLGLLAAAMAGGPIHEITHYSRSDGNTDLVFAQAGKLWRWRVGSGIAATEVLNNGVSFAFPGVGRTVRMVRYGKFLYGCDGVNPLFRVNLEANTAGAYSGQLTPTTAPVAALSSTIVEACSDATVWSGTPAPTFVTDVIVNGSFENDGTGTYNGTLGTYTFPAVGTGGAHWTTVSGNPDSFDTTHQGNCTPYAGSFALLLDNPGETLQQIVLAAALPRIDMTAFGLGSRVAPCYTFYGYFHNADPTGKSSIVVTISAQDGGGNLLETVTKEITQPYDSAAGNWTYREVDVDFSDLLAGGVDPARLVVSLSAGAQNNPGNASIYMDSVHLIPTNGALTPYASGGQIGVAAILGGVGNTQVPFARNEWVRRGYSPAKDLSASSLLAVAMSVSPAVLGTTQTRPRFRFGFTSAADAFIHWSNTCAYSADGLYLSCDVSTVAAAIRSACTGFFLQLLDDLPTAAAGGTIFTFGPITAAGNLVVGGIYTYLADELKTVTAQFSPPLYDVIESSGSPLSNPIQPDGVHAQTRIKVATRVNPQTDTISLFRGGGSFTDGFWRLIARCPYAAPAVPANPLSDIFGAWTWDTTRFLYVGVAVAGWTYDPATQLFVENVPDGELLFAEVYQINRDAWPVGISCLAVANTRLIGAKGNTVYFSWLLGADAESALYTSNLIDPSDPSASLKGARFQLGSGVESDSVVALVPLATATVALRGHVLTHIEGYDPTVYATVDRFRAKGVGCIAPRSAVVDPNGGTIAYLSPSGLKAYNLDTPTSASRMLEGLLPAGMSASVLSTAACVYHDLRLFLFAPANAADSANSSTFVFDSRTEGWTRWTGIGVASACSTGDALYFGGMDGQIYTQGGSVDMATPTAPPTGIPVALLTRAFGSDMPEYIKQPTRMHFAVETAEPSVSVSLSAQGTSFPSVPWNYVYQTRPEGGETDAKARVRASIKGVHITLGLTATVRQPFKMKAIAAETVIGQRR